MRKFFCCFLTLCFIGGAVAQNNSNIKGKKSNRLRPFSAINIQPNIGVSWQSSLFKPIFDFSYIPELFFRPFPIDPDKNTQGFGLDLGTIITVNITTRDYIGIRPNVRFRRDYVYGLDGFPLYSKTVKAFLTDLSGYIVYTHRNRKNKEWIASIGYTVNQVGKSYHFDLSTTVIPVSDTVLNYQYPSFNFGIGYDFYKINDNFFVNGTILTNYIPHGNPAYPQRDFMTLGICFSIRYKPECLAFKIK